MAITEASRHTMLEALRAAIGEDEAMTLAEHLPPVGWADVATKADIAALRGDLRNTEERLEERLGHRIDTVASDLRGFEEQVGMRFDGVDADLRSVEERLGHRIDTVANDLRGFDERVGMRFDGVDADLRSLEQRMDLRFEKLGESVRADISTALYKCSFGTVATLGIFMTAISVFD